MDELPRFSEMLVRRRRELGLTTAQAAQVLKIKEQVLVAFEEGDFESIPKSGYAQGMLSSYARYLGLNARQLTDVFQEELYEHVNGQQSHELRRRTRDVREGRDLEGYETVNEAQSRARAYVAPQGLLPTSGGPAGDLGEFATTSRPSPRSGSSTPLVNSGRTTSLYATGNASYVRGPAGPDDTAAVGSHSRFVNGYSNNARATRETRETRETGARRRQAPSQAQTRRRRSDASSSREARRAYDDLRREDVRTRRASGEGRRANARVESYEPATSAEARRRSRQEGARTPERPNVRRSGERRDAASGSRGRSSANRRRGAQGGRGFGGVGLALVLAVTVALTVTVILSVQSCTSSRDAEQPESVPVATTTTTGTVETGTSTTDEGETEEQGATGSATEETETSGGETSGGESTGSASSQGSVEMVVTLESGEQSWIEVSVDGVSQVADRYTGPWSATYQVSETATVQADNTSAVTVTADGVTKSFSGKNAGVGSVTVTATAASADDTQAEGSANAGE